MEKGPDAQTVVVSIENPDSRMDAFRAVARAVGAGVNQLLERKLVVAADVRKGEEGGLDVLVALEPEPTP